MDGVTVHTSLKTYRVAEGTQQAGGKQASRGGLGVKHVSGVKHLRCGLRATVHAPRRITLCSAREGV